MSDRKIILGIDTSNYTTSCALMYSDGELIANLKRPLTVKSGERGLRQSDAVFAHVKNIPEIMTEVHSILGGESVSAVGVSTRPRNIDGSYMPCFLSGVAVAEGIAAAANAPIYRFSHQCGHLMAAIYSSGRYELLDGREFLAFHVSGGTTEMLSVRSVGDAFSAELVGGTADINAGQLIDRVGVYMGLPFPAGKYMEALAIENKAKIPSRKPKVNDLKVNLSGIENLAIKTFDETGDKSLTAAFVFNYVAESLSLLASEYIKDRGELDILFAGGVMCNSIIKKTLSDRFTAYFAEPEMSADNAVGIAALTARCHK